MKKIKLIAPIIAVAATAVPALTMVACKKDSNIQLALFATTGGELEGNTTFSIKSGTKWSDVQNKPTPKATLGYTFGGWYRGDMEITDDTIINSSMDIYAYFAPYDPETTVYVTVIAAPGGSLHADQQSQIIPVTKGTKWGDVKPETKAYAGYTFDNWYKGDQKLTDDDLINENCYIYAWFKSNETNKFLIQFVANTGGSFTTTSQTIIQCTIPEGQKSITWADIKDKVPTTVASTGYIFDDWYLNSSKTALEDKTELSESAFVVANFTVATVKVEISKVENATVTQPSENLNASNFNVMRKTLDKLVVPNDGYELTGWKIDDNRVWDNKTINENITITPIVEEKMHTYDIRTATDGTKTAYLDRIIDGKAGRENLMVPSYVFENGAAIPVVGIKYYDVSDKPGVYQDNKTIKTVSLPSTMTSVVDRAFKGSSIVTAYIPESITSFKYHSFYSTGSLDNFYYLGTVLQYKAINKAAWWCNGMRTSTAICADGEIKIEK